MTDTAEKLMEELQRLPDDEQDAAAASLLERLRKRKEAQPQREKSDGETLYESFRVLKDARLQLAPDASATYERALYGREGRSDEE